MKAIRFSPLFFRRVHKWVGLILGLQFVLWALSGSVMALLDKDKVRAHGGHMEHSHVLPGGDYFDPARLQGMDPDMGKVTGITLVDLTGRPIYEVRTEKGIRLADATDGSPVTIDRETASAVAQMMNEAPVASIAMMPKANLEARDHTGPMWRVNFADAENSSAYVSAKTGRFLVMRGDMWRTWDFFWMLHNMDYVNRSSFNHPFIIFVAFGTLWLSGTGFYLLFKSFNRSDFKWLRRRKTPKSRPVTAA